MQNLGGLTQPAKSTSWQAIDLCACGRYLSMPLLSAWRSARTGTLLQPGRNRSCRAWRHRSRFSSELWQTVFGGQPLIGQTLESTAGRMKSLASCHPASMSWTTTRQSGCPRAPCGYSSEPRLHPPCHWAPEGRRHRAGGADRVERIPRELGRAYRLVGSCPQSSVARGRPHPSDAAGAGRDCWRCPPFDLDIASRCLVVLLIACESLEPAHGACRVTSS